MKKEFSHLKEIFIENNLFLCMSHFRGKINWISGINKDNYIVYNKSGKKLSEKINHQDIKNVGYNLYSYLKYIIDNYENLPNIIIFCKDNVFTRHINYKLFIGLLKRNTFTSIEDHYHNNEFPVTLSTSDYGFTEINSSWYKNKYPRLFFYNFNCFYKYIFKNVEDPLFLRFAPGANYIVPKKNILLRSKNFYINLLSFIDHSQYSCESHYLERSLMAIWNSNLESSDKMDKKIDIDEMDFLKSYCLRLIKKENVLLEKIYQKLTFTIGSIYMRILKNSIK
tara:strand:- start:10811 stop:11653 length:843 start_codon:yes stop_codon:yes gene_type:complete